MDMKNNPIQSLAELQFLYDALQEVVGWNLGITIPNLDRPFRIVPGLSQDDSAKTLAMYIEWGLYHNQAGVLGLMPDCVALNPDMSRIGFTDFGSVRNLLLSQIITRYVTHTVTSSYDATLWEGPVRKLQPVLNMWNDVKNAQKRLLIYPSAHKGLTSVTWDKVAYDGTRTEYAGIGYSLSSLFLDGSSTSYLWAKFIGGQYEWSENLNLQVDCPKLLSGRALLELRVMEGASRVLKTVLYPVDLTTSDDGFTYPASKFNRSTWEDVLRSAGYDPSSSDMEEHRLQFVKVWYDVAVDWEHKIEEQTN